MARNARWWLGRHTLRSGQLLLSTSSAIRSISFEVRSVAPIRSSRCAFMSSDVGTSPFFSRSRRRASRFECIAQIATFRSRLRLACDSLSAFEQRIRLTLIGYEGRGWLLTTSLSRTPVAKYSEPALLIVTARPPKPVAQAKFATSPSGVCQVPCSGDSGSKNEAKTPGASPGDRVSETSSVNEPEVFNGSESSSR